MSKFQWQILAPAPQDWLEKFPEFTPVVGALLSQRQLNTQAEIESFLHPDFSRDLNSPFLFSQLEVIISRLQQAKNNQELIYIYGDYDADGVCGSAILARTLKQLGFKFAVYLPHREKEGYGLNLAALDFIKAQGGRLVITVDCGISNTPEVAYANSLDLEVIITDHHQLPEVLPAALAILHPQAPGETYPFKYLAGGGVAYKLAGGLIEKSDLPKLEKEKMQKWLLDLVAISAVADMVPLLGENRTLVKYGLIVLSKTQNLGLNELMILANTNIEKISAETIAWQIAPRLNAAGRMEHANTALELLVTDSLEEATALALGLNQNNLDRQQQVGEVLELAKATLQITDQLLIAVGDGWPAGLLGLVSSKITQEFSKPSLIISWDGQQYVGSGRSVKGWNLMEAITKNAGLLDKFGGHPQAAGFRFKKENLEQFLAGMKAEAEQLSSANLQPIAEVAATLDLSEIDWNLVDQVLSLAPFGQGNLEPYFLVAKAIIVVAEKLSEGKHLRLMLSNGRKDRKVMAFGFGQDTELTVGKTIDCLCRIGINQWNGNKEIQLTLIDYKIID